MAMLDHLIIPSHDRKASAKVLADLLGVQFDWAHVIIPIRHLPRCAAHTR